MSEDKIRVIVAMDFSDDVMDRLRAVSDRLHIERHFPDVSPETLQSAEVLYTLRHFPAPENVPHLRWIQLHFAGMDSALRHPIVKRSGLTVTSASGIHAQPIANYVLMMMLAFNYQLPSMFRDQAAVRWRENRYDIYAPQDMDRQTVGIVGYGSIGRELARLANTMGMRVLATKRDVRRPSETLGDYSRPGIGDPAGDIPERLYPGEAVATMAAESDYLVVTVPLTDATQGMINADVFDAMKPTGILINIARGPVVDEPALIAALQNGKIGGAGLDVFTEEPLPKDSPLWQMDNVIISPHVSGNSLSYHEKAADLFAENLKRYVDQRPLLNILNREVGY